MTTYLLRGAYANEFELQNYAPLAKELDLKVITSLHPLTPISLPTIPIWSPADLPSFIYKRQILNRLVGGEHWLLGLEKIIKPGDIIHTAETYYPYTHQAVELRKKGIIKKLICTCWETIPHANEKLSRLHDWKQEAYHYVDLFHTPTERAKQALITEGVDPKKIVVIPYGIDVSRFQPTRKIAEKRPLILTVARLEKEKGMEEIEFVARALPEADFLAIGQGTYNPRGSNIQIKVVPYEQIHTIYQQADIFFLPSRTTPTWEEQYGMALVEAMACGLPIVTTRTGAIPEVVGNAGITIPDRNVEEMVKKIAALVKNHTQRSELSRRARTRAESHYDAQKVAKHLARLY